MQNNKFYILIDSDYAFANQDGAAYFSLIINKTFPSYDWEIIYTDDIPLDGNVYMCLEGAIKSFYREMISAERFRTKDILNSFVINEVQRLYAVSFNYDLRFVKSDREIKQNAFEFLKNTVEPNILKLLSLQDEPQTREADTDGQTTQPESVGMETEDTAVEEGSSRDGTTLSGSEESGDEVNPSSSPVTPTGGNVDEEDMESFTILMNDVISQMINAGNTKIADRSLDEFEGLVIHSSSNPGRFITLANSARKKYENRMLVSELFVILKAATMLGTDSIKFYVRKGATHTT